MKFTPGYTKSSMNTRKGKVKFKNFRILLDSGCNSKIILGRLTQKPNPEEDDVMQWHM